MSVLREELNQVAQSWNQHIISSSKFDNNGPRPDNVYFLTEDYKVEVDRQDIDEFDNHAAMVVQDTNEEIREFADVVMNGHGLAIPTNARSFKLVHSTIRRD